MQGCKFGRITPTILLLITNSSRKSCLHLYRKWFMCFTCVSDSPRPVIQPFGESVYSISKIFFFGVLQLSCIELPMSIFDPVWYCSTTLFIFNFFSPFSDDQFKSQNCLSEDSVKTCKIRWNMKIPDTGGKGCVNSCIETAIPSYKRHRDYSKKNE